MHSMVKFWSKLTRSEHRWIKENLSAYIDGELSPAETARVERHLEQCEQCRRELDSLTQTVHLLNRLPALRAPRSFLLPAEAEESRRRFKARTRVYYALQGATVLAALLLVFAVTGDLMLRHGWGIGSMTKVASSPIEDTPEIVATVAPEKISEGALSEGTVQETLPAEEMARVPAKGKGIPTPSESVRMLQLGEKPQAVEQTPVVVLPEVAKGFGSDHGATVPGVAAPTTTQPQVGALALAKPTEAPPEEETIAVTALMEQRVWIRRVQIAVILVTLVLLTATLIVRRGVRGI